MIEERVILRRTKRERQKERLKSKFNRYSLNLFSKGTIFDITISTDHMILSRQTLIPLSLTFRSLKMNS